MKRVPEPALMNDPAQAAAYAGPHLDNAYWLFVQLFQKCFPDLEPHGAILDLGCGTAGIPLRLARIFSNCEIHCVDGSAQMLDYAGKAVQGEGLDRQVHLFHGYLPDKFLLPCDRYGTVISNSFLHHLDDPMVLWQTLQQYGLPNAAVLVIDLLRPTNEERAQLIINNYLAEGPPLLRQDMLLSLRAAFTLDEIAAQLQKAGLSDRLTLTMATPFQFAVYGHLS